MQVAMGPWTMQIIICEWVKVVCMYVYIYIYIPCITQYHHMLSYIKCCTILDHPRQVAMGSWTMQIILCEYGVLNHADCNL